MKLPVSTTLRTPGRKHRRNKGEEAASTTASALRGRMPAKGCTAMMCHKRGWEKRAEHLSRVALKRAKEAAKKALLSCSSQQMLDLLCPALAKRAGSSKDPGCPART
eukprot:1037617-Pelagomonas_calceolata.AAC.2